MAIENDTVDEATEMVAAAHAAQTLDGIDQPIESDTVGWYYERSKEDP